MIIDELFWYSNPKIWKERFIYIVKQYFKDDITDNALIKMKDLFVATFPLVCKQGKEMWVETINNFIQLLIEKKYSNEEIQNILKKTVKDYEEVSRTPTGDEEIIATYTMN